MYCFLQRVVVMQILRWGTNLVAVHSCIVCWQTDWNVLKYCWRLEHRWTFVTKEAALHYIGQLTRFGLFYLFVRLIYCSQPVMWSVEMWKSNLCHQSHLWIVNMNYNSNKWIAIELLFVSVAYVYMCPLWCMG